MTTTRDRNQNLIQAGHTVNVRSRRRGRFDDRGQIVEVQAGGRLVLIESMQDQQLRTYPADHCYITSPWR